MDKNKIIEILKYISKALAEKKYEEIAKNDFKHLLSKDDISLAIMEYGGTITKPPNNAYESVDIYIVKENVEANIEFDLWIDSQKSDLTLSCNIINQNGIYEYTVENIHVL